MKVCKSQHPSVIALTPLFHHPGQGVCVEMRPAAALLVLLLLAPPTGGDTTGSLQEVCSPSQLECYDGDCFEPFRRCDGVRDCSSGEDELDCPFPENQFPCELSYQGGNSIDSI